MVYFESERKSHVFKLKMDYGKGTNTKGEWLVIQGFLYLVHTERIINFQVTGDSKVIIGGGS